MVAVVRFRWVARVALGAPPVGFTVAGAVVVDGPVATAGASVSGDGVFTFRRFLPRPSWSSSSSSAASVAIDDTACGTAVVAVVVTVVVVVAGGGGILRWLPTDASIA